MSAFTPIYFKVSKSLISSYPILTCHQQVSSFSRSRPASLVWQTYHKRLLSLNDFSPEEVPTWPRSRGRLGMIRPEGHHRQQRPGKRFWVGGCEGLGVRREKGRGGGPRGTCAYRHALYLNKALTYPDQDDAAVVAARSWRDQHVEGRRGHYCEAKHPSNAQETKA